MATSDRAPAAVAATIIVHSLAHAVAAATAAAESSRPVRLRSAHGAAGYAGAGWFLALVAAARARVPEAEVTGVLDCADDLAIAIEAIGAGAPHVAFSGPPPAAARLRDIAARAGATMEPAPGGRDCTLDLGAVADPLAAARNFLA